MEKSSSAFRTISEVAVELDVPKHVLRFWEGKFSQLKPMKRGGGRRYYRPEDVDLLRGIRWLLYDDGYTIKGVQRILRDSGVRYVKQCWRGEGAVNNSQQIGARSLEIPNLAGEAASQARQTALARQSGASTVKRNVRSAVVEKALPEQDSQVFLLSLVQELEECREILRAASRSADH